MKALSKRVSGADKNPEYFILVVGCTQYLMHFSAIWTILVVHDSGMCMHPNYGLTVMNTL